jgi:hypothetical protein
LLVPEMFFGTDGRSSVTQTRRMPLVRPQLRAERAGGAREHEAPHAGRNGRLQQIERAGDVGIDKILS